MRICLLLVIIVLIFPIVSAAELSVKKIEKEPVLIFGIERPAKYTLFIKNEDISDSFEIYSLVGVSIEPKELFSISSGATKELDIKIIPHKETLEEIRGNFVFDYEIKGQKTGFFKDTLKIKILEIQDALDIRFPNIKPSDDEINIMINNKEKFNFEGLKIILSSDFFNYEDTISLPANEIVNLTIPINNQEIQNLLAGEYNIKISLENENAKESIEEKINYLEIGGISVSTESEGKIVKRKTISKTNEGNIPVMEEISDKRNLFSRLFTTFSPAPVRSEKSGFFVEYFWAEKLEPTESLVVTSVTNYTLPFAILIAIILIVIAMQLYLYRTLGLEKRVSLIKTKGGEFALKVRVNVKARRKADNVQIIDTTPIMAKLYEKFGKKPDRIDEKSRRLFWTIGSMNRGEERTISYIIYSKMQVIGTLTLPAATAIYQREGKIFNVISNKTAFVAESAERGDED